jgi:glycosyltransferase involved in cell wall biosynthesis
MNVGGPALEISGLMRGLDAARFDHRLLVGEVQEGEEDFLALRAPDIEAKRLAGLGRDVRFVGDARALLALRAEIRNFRPHIVHTHTAKAGVLGRVAALTTGHNSTPAPALVHTFHGHLLHGYFSPSVTAAVAQVEAALARRTDRLLSVGAQVRDDLVAAGIGRADQYEVMPPGVSLPAAPAMDEARRLLDLPPDVPVLAFVGRLTAIKQPLRMLAVARSLLEHHPGLHVVVAGGGPMYDEVTAAAAPLGGRVRMLGWRPDVETVYGAADLLLLTSDNEGMPITLIEAALSGTPAVATDVGSVREVLIDGSTGLVTPPDEAALTEAADRLLRDPEVRSHMASAARDAGLKFSTTRLVTATSRIYEDLVRVTG